MGWSIFISEPGDHQFSLPYGVLAGILIEDRFVWQLARKLKDAETQFFGRRLNQLGSSFNVENILGLESSQLAESAPPLSSALRLALTNEFLSVIEMQGSLQHSLAMAQSCHSFIRFVLSLLLAFKASAVAIMFPVHDITLSYNVQLRKDYAFLIERVERFLSEKSSESVGLMIFDKYRYNGKYVNTKSITEYFEKTTKGRLRAQRVIPEPVFAGASLSTINNAAVLFSTVLSWSFRLPFMSQPRRLDLDDCLKQCNTLRFSYTSETGSKDWSFKYVDNLRARNESEAPIRGT